MKLGTSRLATSFGASFVCVWVGVALAMSAPAFAWDDPRFRVIDITALGPDFYPNVDLNGSMGINTCGQVVYGFHFVDPEAEPPIDEYRAWVWLPAAAHGISAGWHDLNDLTSGEGLGIARDINDAGIIVGQSPDVAYGESTASRDPVTIILNALQEHGVSQEIIDAVQELIDP